MDKSELKVPLFIHPKAKTKAACTPSCSATGWRTFTSVQSAAPRRCPDPSVFHTVSLWPSVSYSPWCDSQQPPPVLSPPTSHESHLSDSHLINEGLLDLHETLGTVCKSSLPSPFKFLLYFWNIQAQAFYSGSLGTFNPVTPGKVLLHRKPRPLRRGIHLLTPPPAHTPAAMLTLLCDPEAAALFFRVAALPVLQGLHPDSSPGSPSFILNGTETSSFAFYLSFCLGYFTLVAEAKHLMPKWKEIRFI